MELNEKIAERKREGDAQNLTPKILTMDQRRKVAVVGSRTLLGKHLMDALANSGVEVVKEWNFGDAGIDSLVGTLRECEVVFNLHEVQDFSVAPNLALMEQHNVTFVEHLLQCCERAGCRRVVQLSSVYLQCSVRWPNVNAREMENAGRFRHECPFPEYCQGKALAEQMLRNSQQDIQSVIARVGPLYGEGDQHSLVCDAILAQQLFGSVPLIGDQGGILQFTYVGNAAYALLKCAEKFFANGGTVTDGNDDECFVDFRTETVLISDKTPLKEIYSLMMDKDDGLLMVDDEGEEESSSKSNNVPRIWPPFRLPFLLFYPLYWMLSIFVWLLGTLIGDGTKMGKLHKIPCPHYLYMLFRQWTFFSDFKLALFFNVKPKFGWPECRRRSRAYYRQLMADQIVAPSWMPAPIH